jgi:arabinofuranosyltransferase
MFSDRQRILRYLLILLPTVVVLVGGWRYRWVSDDAYIDFRVVHNILSGYGPVFNPGERVEAYTDPLWVVLLTFFSGLLRFIDVEWWSVLLGLVFTGGGFWLASLGTVNFAEHRTSKPIFPVGVLCVSCVAGVWMFATSGLETGLIFGWLGLSWWMLVRSFLNENKGILATALVVSLGFTIRPDMVLFTLSFGIALFVLRSQEGREDRPRRKLTLLLALTAIPLASELFRIAYYGMLVSNTALAKSASSIWLRQGLTYFTNFTGTYWLWIPFIILTVVTAYRMRTWWRFRFRLEILLIAAPIVGGLLDVVYVTAIGGDFMHARMLLPGFFSIFMICWFEGLPSPRNVLVISGVTIWALLCVLLFRFVPPGDISANGIANERAYYIDVSEFTNPITPRDFDRDAWEIEGEASAAAAPSTRSGNKLLNWNRSEFYSPVPEPALNYPITTSLHETYYVGFSNIGLFGLAAGDRVYVFDELSLANPIGAHFIVYKRTRPGHEKIVAPVWLDARFGSLSIQLPNGVNQTELVAARKALACQPLSGYLRSITDPLSFSQIVSNFEHAFTWTTMHYSSDPFDAEKQLCGA